jgi:small neutral amino acid transporter SnatA (MarC family)
VTGYQEYLRFIVTLTAVLDPFLAVPIFLSVTASSDTAARQRLAGALAGPGAISTTIIAAQTGGVAHISALIACIALVCLVLWSILRVADAIGPRMGTTGLNIATRLLGLILAAIAIETMADGLKALFPGLT